MSVDHDSVVWFAKTVGLLYLIALSVGVAIYAYWPSNRARFDQAARSVLSDEDTPWR